MRRRDLIRLLGSAAAVPALSGLAPDRLLAVALDAHGRATGRAGSPGGSNDGRGAARFRVFDADQAEAVATIAELIIPETDTPGARAAGVPEFIDLVVAEWYEADERERFLEGLAGVDARSRTTFAADFTALPRDRQVAVLHGLDAEVMALREAADRRELEEREAAVPGGLEGAPEAETPASVETPEPPIEQVEPPPGVEEPAEATAGAATAEPAGAMDPDDHFFAQMKWLTLYGYYTSEVGVNQELEHVVIPGRFDPCAATGLRPEPEGR